MCVRVTKKGVIESAAPVRFTQETRENIARCGDRTRHGEHFRNLVGRLAHSFIRAAADVEHTHNQISQMCGQIRNQPSVPLVFSFSSAEPCVLSSKIEHESFIYVTDLVYATGESARN